MQGQQAQGGGNHQGDRQSCEQTEPGRQAIGGQHGAGIRADTDERGLAERGHAANAGQQHQAQGDQAIQADVVQQGDMEAGQQSGCQAGQQQQGKQGDQPDGSSVLLLKVRVLQRKPQQDRDHQGTITSL